MPIKFARQQPNLCLKDFIYLLEEIEGVNKEKRSAIEVYRDMYHVLETVIGSYDQIERAKIQLRQGEEDFMQSQSRFIKLLNEDVKSLNNEVEKWLEETESLVKEDE